MSTSAAELLANEAFVRRLARGLAGDGPSADDLVQETWLAALRAGPSHRGLRSWLARVLRNLAASGLRGRVRREARESACAAPASQPDTSELVERMELQQRLVAAVLGLPEAYRDAILRHYFRGESVQAIALVLSRPEATIRTRLRRAREQLRSELGGRTPGEPSAFLAVLAALEPSARWTTELTMKKTLLQTPLIVAGFLGAGLGFGGSLLVRDEPAPEPSGAARPARAAELLAEPPEVGASTEAVERAPAVSMRAPVRTQLDPGREAPDSMSEHELRRLLLSSDRMDQVRAIRLLQEQGTSAAHALLLETFLSAHDGILLALLEEAVLASGMEVSATVIEGYLTTRDPERLQRLASMLLELVGKDPALRPQVVELFIEALREPGPDGERLAGLGEVLVALGASALEGLTAYLSDPLSDPRGAQAAAFALVKIDPLAAEDVRQRLGETFDALIEALGGELASDEQRRALLERTSSLAWAASSRPAEEHEALGAMLAERLFHATDQQQAQTLAWGITSMRGLSHEARARLVRSILEALPAQASPDLRQSYVWAVNQLATDYGSRALDQGFVAIERLVEEHMNRHGSGQGFAMQLAWLWHELQAHRERAGG